MTQKAEPFKSSNLSVGVAIMLQTCVRCFGVKWLGSDVSFEWRDKNLKLPVTDLRVLGIDPGLTRMGWGVVEQAGGTLNPLASGTLVSSPGEHAGRLRTIFTGLQGLIATWGPGAVAVEKVFLKINLNTGVASIQAAGIAMLAAALADVAVHEYSPAQVKLAVVGNGSATKDQVQFMIRRLLGAAAVPDTADAADALAVAVTHLNSQSIIAMSEASR